MSKISNDNEDIEFDPQSEDDTEIPSGRSFFSKIRTFNFDGFIDRNKIAFSLALFGLILAGLGVFIFKNTSVFVKDKIEVINEPTVTQDAGLELVVEIAGSVEKPGVYKFKSGSRIDDLLIASGGLSADADRDWVERYINKAGKLSDGQKIYIQSVNNKQETINSKQTDTDTANNDGGYQTVSGVLGTDTGDLVNINTATFAELDKLPGIGQVYGQKIIEQRPYSTIEELLSRGILPKTTYEKIKEKITVY